MVINRTFEAVCKGCGKKFNLYEYVGLEGGRYGDHYCPEIREYLLRHPRRWKTYNRLQEVRTK